MKHLILIFGLLLAACDSDAIGPDPSEMTWPEIEAAAEGTTVHMLTWTGDATINRYMEGWGVPELQARYGITLDLASVAGPRIVSFIMAEREAGQETSEADLVWMNGRTSRSLRRLNVLMGQLDSRLPNYQYIEAGSPFIAFDYDIPIAGYQVPWGQGQFLLITDEARVPNPPHNMAELEAWVKANPGRFTLDAGFTTLAFLKILLVELAGDREAFGHRFNEELYNELAPKLWDYLDGLKPYMWREGTTFAKSVAQMHQMFAAGEIDFTMSYNDGETDAKIASGLFPESAYGYVWFSGTPRNAHYLGVINNGRNRAGAMVVANFLISHEAQFEKLRRGSWGDNTVLDIFNMDDEWGPLFEDHSRRQRAPNLASIEDFAFTELHPDYIDRLYNDYLEHVVRAGQ